MKITAQTNYPNLCGIFRSQAQLARFLKCSERTVRRSMSGKRPFDEYEIKKMEEYTGAPRTWLLKKRSNK